MCEQGRGRKGETEPCVVLLLLLFLSIYLFLREREGEKGRERIPSRLHTISLEPDLGLELMSQEIIT